MRELLEVEPKTLFAPLKLPIEVVEKGAEKQKYRDPRAGVIVLVVYKQSR